MRGDIERVLLGETEIQSIVKRLGQEISNDYKDKTPLIVGILKGSFVFMADLVRQIDVPCSMDFMAISSYGRKSKSSGEVKIIKDLDTNLEGRHVIVVEDILDSGNTISYLLRLLKARKVASVKVCVLLDKPERRVTDVTVDYAGVNIPDEFVVGYGLDYDEKYRNLPDVCILKREVYM